MEKHTKIIAIYNTFDGEELLEGSIKCLRDHVDFVLVVAQRVSNFGEKYDGGYNVSKSLKTVDLVIDYVPELKLGGMGNEIRKRNLGLEYAKQHGFTHFLCVDNDEYWGDFNDAKVQFLNSGALSSVATMWTFFKQPTLRLERPESYFVPFITKLEENSLVGNYQTGYYCDPTRKPNNIGFDDIVVVEEKMSHFSYVRKDIMRKVRNSTAAANIAKSTLLQDYNSEVGPGSYINYFDQHLIEVPNTFGIEI